MSKTSVQASHLTAACLMLSKRLRSYQDNVPPEHWAEIDLCLTTFEAFAEQMRKELPKLVTAPKPQWRPKPDNGVKIPVQPLPPSRGPGALVN